MSEHSEKEPIVIVFGILLTLALLVGLWFVKHLLLFYFLPAILFGVLLGELWFQVGSREKSYQSKNFSKLMLMMPLTFLLFGAASWKLYKEPAMMSLPISAITFKDSKLQDTFKSSANFLQVEVVSPYRIDSFTRGYQAVGGDLRYDINRFLIALAFGLCLLAPFFFWLRVEGDERKRKEKAKERGEKRMQEANQERWELKKNSEAKIIEVTRKKDELERENIDLQMEVERLKEREEYLTKDRKRLQEDPIQERPKLEETW